MTSDPKPSFLMDLIKPIYNFLLARKEPYFTSLRQNFTDWYLSGMVSRFNLWHTWIFRPYFEKVRTNPHDIEKLRELSQNATVVYVMKNAGQLDYSFFNHLFLREGIPLARFANKARTLFWRPIGEIFSALMARWDRYYTGPRISDPIQDGALEKYVGDGDSVLLNLKVSRDFVFGASEDPVAFIPPLLSAAMNSPQSGSANPEPGNPGPGKPVYLVTQQFIYDRHPGKEGKSFADVMFGERSNPGVFRKLVMFLLSYRSRATVKIGEPINLGEFIRENPGATIEAMAKKLKNILLERLVIEQKSILGPSLQPRALFLDKILEDSAFQEKFAALRETLKLSESAAKRQVEKYYNEIAADMNYSYIEFYDKAVHWLTNHIYDGLDVDTLGLEKIKKVAGRYPIVLVPSHKSHVDYMLLSYLFYNHDLSMPYVCAGLNMKFWPVGSFIRKGGGFYIRRSIRGIPLYKLVLEHYLKALVSGGYSIEFFIEGTRSRNGKLLKPRTGILSMIIQNYLEGAAPDIYFVPIAINYERILEEKSYSREIAGGEKSKENVAGLLKAGEKINKKYGRVSIQFADPISLKGFLEEKGMGAQADTVDTRRADIENFALKLTYNINKVSMVTATSLVAAASLTYPRKGIPAEEIKRRTSLLKNYLEYKEAPLSSVLVQNDVRSCQEAMAKLVKEKVVEEHLDFHETFYTLSEGGRGALDYHKNNSLHFFVSIACFSKICRMALSGQLGDVSGVLPYAVLEKNYEILKSLLKKDFTFSERSLLKDHLTKIIRYYERENVLQYDAAKEELHLHTAAGSELLAFFGSLLDNYFEAYWLTLIYLKHVPFEKKDNRELVTAILEKGRILYKKGDLIHPEALSRFTIENALLSFQDLGLLRVEGGSQSRASLTNGLDAESALKWEKLLWDLKGEAQSLKRDLSATFLLPSLADGEEINKELH